MEGRLSGHAEPTELHLEVAPGTTAGLQLEHVAPWRQRLVRGGVPVIWTRTEAWLQGFWMLAEPLASSPGVLPPFKAAEARARARDPGRWLHAIRAALLSTSHGPLRAGRWRLRWVPPNVAGDASERQRRSFTRALREAFAPPGPRLEHFSLIVEELRCVVLRRPSSPDAPRVKAWRKHARAGSLPPVVLWELATLDGYVVLDGHDRACAALAEGVDPPIVVLEQWAEDRRFRHERIAWRAKATERYLWLSDTVGELMSTPSWRAATSHLVEAHRAAERSITTAAWRPAHYEAWRTEVEARVTPEHPGREGFFAADE